jgi:DNA-binding winged helix-turn-helix (wHTH) protein
MTERRHGPRLLFGEFVLDPRARQLRRRGQPVHLTPKAFELLGALLERRPEAVGREELERRIWGDVHVAETSLAGLVTELRSALGDGAREARFVRTVHGFGYAFSAAATSVSAASGGESAPLVFRLSWGRREIALHAGENVLGRVEEAVVWLDSPSVSRRHARIVVSGEEATIEDLGSRNGTFVRGERVAAPTPLHDRDEIRLGSLVMTFRVHAAAETESAPDG